MSANVQTNKWTRHLAGGKVFSGWFTLNIVHKQIAKVYGVLLAFCLQLWNFKGGWVAWDRILVDVQMKNKNKGLDNWNTVCQCGFIANTAQKKNNNKTEEQKLVVKLLKLPNRNFKEDSTELSRLKCQPTFKSDMFS